MSQNNDQRPATSQLNLLLRIVIGGYLLYTTYDMRDHFGEPAFTVAAVIFAVAGVWLVVNSVKRMFTGEFDYLDSEGKIIVPDDLDDLDDIDDLDDQLEQLKQEVADQGEQHN